MGCGGSSANGGGGVNKAQNKALEAKLAKEAKAESEKIKLLLLGAGESGKSTIFKQMKLIYGVKHTEKERKESIPIIHCNILQAMKLLCDQAVIFGVESQIQAKNAFEMIKNIDENEKIDVVIGGAVKELWQDPGMRVVWDRRTEFQLIESVQYYFNKIDIVKMPDYLPDQDDILYSRVRTSGIVTESYIIDGTTFEMYDVGGQRNERKKWIHCFEGVTAVIFVCAISEYDQKLFEDITTNRIIEALTLFEEICNNAYFAKSSMILFLNKQDLFANKIKTRHIRDTPIWNGSRDDIPAFTGPEGDYDAGVKYFLDLFLAKNKAGSERQIYHHVTCATDTRNVRVVFDACKDIILRENLKNSGYMD